MDRRNLLAVMKKRSTKPPLKVFGRLLREARREATREQISKRLEKLGVPLGGSTLAQYEQGSVWAPDPGVLWGLSKIYRVALDDLILVLRENRARPELEVLENRQLATDFVHGVRHEIETHTTESAAAHGVPPPIDSRGSDEDRRLLMGRVEGTHGFPDMEEAFARVDRLVGELAVAVDQLPGRPAAVVGTQRAEDVARRGPARPKHRRKRSKKAARD